MGTPYGIGLQLIQALIEDLEALALRALDPISTGAHPQTQRQTAPTGDSQFPRQKLLQTVLKLLLEAIYEPTFSPASHGLPTQP